MPDWVRPMVCSGHSSVWQRHPERFCRKELYVSPVTSVIKNVQSASEADSPGGPTIFYASLLPCRWGPRSVQGSTPPPRSLGFDPFCPTPQFVNFCTTDILNLIIFCCGDFVGLCSNRIFCSPLSLCATYWYNPPSPTPSGDNQK